MTGAACADVASMYPSDFDRPWRVYVERRADGFRVTCEPDLGVIPPGAEVAGRGLHVDAARHLAQRTWCVEVKARAPKPIVLCEPLPDGWKPVVEADPCVAAAAALLRGAPAAWTGVFPASARPVQDAAACPPRSTS